jgi:hypothetical protein
MNKFQAEKIINAYGGAIASTEKPFKKTINSSLF